MPESAGGKRGSSSGAAPPWVRKAARAVSVFVSYVAIYTPLKRYSWLALIANIGVDAFVQRHFRTLRCRNMQTALRHQGEQTHRLERDGFAACVWPRDDEDEGLVIQHHINRDDLAWVKQRFSLHQRPSYHFSD